MQGKKCNNFIKYISHQGIPSAPFLTSFALDVLGKADIQMSRSCNFAEVRRIRYVDNGDKEKEKKIYIHPLLTGMDLTMLVSNVGQVSLFWIFTNVIRFPDEVSLSWDDKKYSPTLFLIYGWKEKEKEREGEGERINILNLKNKIKNPSSDPNHTPGKAVKMCVTTRQ